MGTVRTTQVPKPKQTAIAVIGKPAANRISKVGQTRYNAGPQSIAVANQMYPYIDDMNSYLSGMDIPVNDPSDIYEVGMKFAIANPDVDDRIDPPTQADIYEVWGGG